MKRNDAFEYSEPRGPLRRFGLPIGLGLIGVVALGLVIKMLSSASGNGPMRHEEMVMLRPLPPPPQVTPPPPAPQPQQTTPQKQEMMEQAPISEEEQKPAETPHEEASAPLGTNLAGTGGPDYGLAHGGNGGMIGGTGNGSGRSEGPYAAYGRKLQHSILEALQRDPRTRSTSFNLTNVRIFPDDFGRISKVNLGASTGDPERDAAVREILKSLQLPEPPAGIPKPIHLRVIVRRPNG